MSTHARKGKGFSPLRLLRFPDLAMQPVPQALQLSVTARTLLHRQRGAQTPGEVGRRFARAQRGSPTLPFPAHPGVKLRKMSSGGGGGKKNKQTPSHQTTNKSPSGMP